MLHIKGFSLFFLFGLRGHPVRLTGSLADPGAVSRQVDRRLITRNTLAKLGKAILSNWIAMLARFPGASSLSQENALKVKYRLVRKTH